MCRFGRYWLHAPDLAGDEVVEQLDVEDDDDGGDALESFLKKDAEAERAYPVTYFGLSKCPFTQKRQWHRAERGG